MIITRAPFRISFVGGGSDLKDFYSQFEGAVLSTTINKYVYISSHHFFDTDKIRIKYSQTETVSNFDEIKHPIFKEVLRQFNTTGALEISSNADIPAGSGLGSSSAFTVALLHNLYTRSRKFITKKHIAELACNIEIEKLGEPIGKQDQYASAYGGLNMFTFHHSDAVSIEKIYLNSNALQKLQNNLLLFFIGNTRKTSSILTEQKQNMRSIEKINILKHMVKLVENAKHCLLEGQVELFGEILHENWLLKQKLASKISNEEINRLYSIGLKSGALGGKLLGAGAGGFLLFYCDIQYQTQLRKALGNYPEMKFNFENEGAKVIYIGDEEYV